MKGYSIFRSLLIIIATVFSGTKINGQSPYRMMEDLKEGEIIILSDTERDRAMYQALTVADVSLDDCLEVFRHAELHSDILAGTSHAELIQIISEEHWYNYYFFKGGLGMPDYDAVMKMVLFPGGDQNSFTILGKATPTLYESRGIDRITSYEIICFVKKLDNDKVVISISTEFEPIFPAARWKIKAWYPRPEELLEGVVWQATNM